MDRTIALNLASDAARKAALLAEQAHHYATHPDYGHKVGDLVAAGGLWADTARAYAAIAEALPAEPAADSSR